MAAYRSCTIGRRQAHSAARPHDTGSSSTSTLSSIRTPTLLSAAAASRSRRSHPRRVASAQASSGWRAPRDAGASEERGASPRGGSPPPGAAPSASGSAMASSSPRSAARARSHLREAPRRARIMPAPWMFSIVRGTSTWNSSTSTLMAVVGLENCCRKGKCCGSRLVSATTGKCTAHTSVVMYTTSMPSRRFICRPTRSSISRCRKSGWSSAGMWNQSAAEGSRSGARECLRMATMVETYSM
mmetsp:Transcript_12934/g.32714  ORF Transcript_12934/g.32714 Transcript_12934/m.32714 type:complete len:243 (+) Transcript_12934:958-1686(+)